MLGRGAVKAVTPNEQSTLLLPLDFLAAVDSWFQVLLPKIYPFLYHNGGNIISIQVWMEWPGQEKKVQVSSTSLASRQDPLFPGRWRMSMVATRPVTSST